jgi:type II secretory pathway predicted ATPase ExeA
MVEDTNHRTTRERISIANQVYAGYPLFNQVLEDIDRCHDSPNIKGDDDPDCLLLMGSTGAGKTTIYKTYAQNYPSKETEEGSVVPIIYATIPAAATVKGLVEALLKQLGDPLHNKGTTINQTSRLYDLLKACQVELIFLDEFHHFIDRESDKVLKNVCDWLKNLILNTKIPIVLFGLPESEKILTVDNWQLSRRFNYRHSLIPFPRTESGLELFRQFLSDVESQLPLATKSELAEKSLSERIYYATDGTIGHVMTLIRKGATLAIEQDLDRLDLSILGVIYDKHLKHDKFFKKTDPFMRSAFGLEAAYAQDSDFDEATGKRKKDSVKDVFRKQ